MPCLWPWDHRHPAVSITVTDSICGCNGLLCFSFLCIEINLECAFPLLGRERKYYLAYLSPPCSNICNPLVAISNSKPAVNTMGCVFSSSCFPSSKAFPGFDKSSGSSHHFVPLVCIVRAVQPDQLKELYLLNTCLVFPLLLRILLCVTALPPPYPQHPIVL